MTSQVGSEFDADTAVAVLGWGRYAATVTDRWSTMVSPNGGYLLTIALRALTAEMPMPHPLVVSAYYLRPGRVGPASLHAEVIRAGRRTATGQVTLAQEGREVLRALATFGDLDRFDGRTAVFNSPPGLLPPEECVDPLSGVGLPGITIADRVESRFAEIPGWLRGEPADEPRMQFWMRFADGREPDSLSLALLVDAAPPVVLDVGAGDSTTLELTVHLRARPAPGWLACRVGTQHLQGGLHEEDFEIWDSTGTLVAQSRQLALLA